MKKTEASHAGPGDSRPVRDKALQRIAAGVTGAAVVAATLATGATLGIWHGGQSAVPAAVDSGELDLTLGTDHGWFDVTDLSPTKPATAVDPGSYPVTPGDRLEKVQEITVKLTGDNIAAELAADVKGFQGALANQGLSGTVRLVRGSYIPTSGLQPGADVVTTTPIIDNVTAPKFTFNSAVAPADGKYTVLTDLVFTQAAGAGQSATAVLANSNFILKQVRKGAPKTWVIADPWLAYYVADKLGVPQDKLTTDDALRLTSLDLTSGGGMYGSVSSLEGMQLATNLTSADLSRTDISDLSPLNGATQLTDFTGKSMNKLTSIDGLTGLKLVNVNLEWTQLTSVSAFSGMDRLQNVDLLGVLPVSDISALAGKPDLARLIIAYTAVSNLEPLRSDTALEYFDGRQIPATDWSAVNNAATIIGRQ